MKVDFQVLLNTKQLTLIAYIVKKKKKPKKKRKKNPPTYLPIPLKVLRVSRQQQTNNFLM